MKKHLLLIVILVYVAASNSYSQTPTWKWGRSGVGNDYDLGYAVATDANGNAIVVGYFNSDSITFSSVTLQNSALGYTDMAVVKYDSSGNVLWAKGYGGNDDDKAYSVATDVSGNVYVAGNFYSDTITFGSFTLISTDATADIFVVKYDPFGNVVWAKKEGGVSLEIPYDIAVDGSGNTIVVGRFSSTQIVFGTDTLLQQGSMDVFVVKYDNAGNVLWGRGAGGGSNDEAYSVGVDAAGNIYVAGYFNQHATFGAFTLTSEGQADIFLAKYDPSGTVLWVKGVGADGDDRAQAISVDASSNIYIAGFYTNDTITFGSIPLPQENGDNSFMAKYTSSGNVVWAKAMHGDSKANGIAVTHGNVYVCGSFSADTLTFEAFTLFLLGSTDLYLLKFDTAGNTNWLIKQTAGGESTDAAYSVSADLWGNVFITGNFGSHEPLTFGSDVLEPNDNSYDIYVARLGVNSVGIDDLQNENGALIYPNPSNGQFILHSAGVVETVEVYDVMGIKIYSSTNIKPDSGNEINLSSLPAGTYFVKVVGRGNQFLKKIIVGRN